MLTLIESKKGIIFKKGEKEAQLVEYWPRLQNDSVPSKDGNETLTMFIGFLLQTDMEFAVQSDVGEVFHYQGYGEEGLDIFVDLYGKCRMDLKETFHTPIDFNLERKRKECWLFKLASGNIAKVLPQTIEIDNHSLTEFTFMQHWLLR